MLSLFFFKSSSSKCLSGANYYAQDLKDAQSSGKGKPQNYCLSVATSPPSNYQSPSSKNFQVTHNFKRNLKQRLKKKSVLAVSLKLKLASKRNLSKIQGKHYFLNYSSSGIFPPRSSGPKGHPCKLRQSRLQKASWQAGYRLR